MANVCATSIRIVGPADQIEKLSLAFDSAQESGYVSSGCVSLRQVLMYLGCTEEDIRLGRTCSCAGSIYWRGFAAGTKGCSELRMELESKWVPTLGPVCQMMARYAPDAKLMFVADEPGMELHVSNEPDYVGSYVAWEASDLGDFPIADSQDPFTEAELLKELEEDLGKTGPIEELMKEFCEKYGCRFVRYENAAPEDYF